MKKQNTRRALLMSALSILLCVSMLVGTTFAWFTDEVKSGKNQIVAGNLDIELEYSKVVDGDLTAWAPVQGKTDIFDPEALWEPGRVEVVYLKVSNLGTLALKYQLSVNFDAANEVPGINVDGDPFKLSEHLVFKTVLIDETQVGTYTRESAKEAAGVEKGLTDYKGDTTSLEVGGNDCLALIVYMPESVGNEANYRGDAIPKIELGINLLATQDTVEADSWGSDYDKDAKIPVAAGTLTEVLTELAAGNNVLLSKTIIINGDAADEVAALNAITYAVRDTIVVDNNVEIDGFGGVIYRTEEMKDKAIFQIEEGYTLTLSNITVDGGAKWEGEVNAVLQRPTTNVGIVTTGAIVAMSKNSHLVLNEGAVLQNNDGANAVNLNTRVGATLTLNGGEIINNHSAAGAIWGGGAITINSGKVNGNHGGIGGAIRAVTNIGTLLTMNGGEMNHNLSDSVGGAIWAGSSKSNNVYVLNGGEMAYNYSPETGGAIYAGYYETVKIGGTFKMHDNDCAANIGAAIRFHDHASFVMTGGEVYNNGDNANALFLYNNSASITGGKIVGDFGYSGGLGLTWGNAEVDGVITFNLGTNHNTAYLAAEFGTLKFIVTEGANFANFNFKPAAGYTYTEGDEAKLVCLNEGYETYWDAANAVFKIKLGA